MNQHDLLLKKIQDADKAYYDDDNPIMSDRDYDKIRSLFIQQYGDKDLDYVPGNIKKELKPFHHTSNINSLFKVKQTEQEELMKQIKKLSPVVLELKLDGLTIVAYPDGKYVTRGNGTDGEILLHFPERYHHNTSEYPIRGEAFLKKSDFEEINKQREEEGLPLFANARNASAGILRRLDKSSYLDKIQFVCYDVIGYDVSEDEKLKYIKEYTDFDVINSTSAMGNPIQIVSMIEQMYQTNSDGEIPIDGIVVKSNINKSLETFGSTVHHPLNAFAYKAEDEIKITTIRDIIWNVGREKVTPIAVFDPVLLEGTTVSNASLSNAGIAKSFDFHIGDIISVQKANKIIPQVVEKVEDKHGMPISEPLYCPSCRSKLEVRKQTLDDGYDLICINPNCIGKLANTIEYMFSKQNLNVKGLSAQTIKKLIDKKYVSEPTDIFKITKEQLKTLDGFGDKSASNLYNGIHNISSAPLNVFIASVGALGIGSNVGNILANNFHTYENVLKVLEAKDKDALQELKGIGTSVTDILLSEDFIQKMKDLREFVIPTPVLQKDIKLKVVITGQLSKSRTEYTKFLKEHDIQVSSSVTKNTNYVITDNPNGTSTKLKKAKELNIPIISEQQMDELIRKE